MKMNNQVREFEMFGYVPLTSFPLEALAVIVFLDMAKSLAESHLNERTFCLLGLDKMMLTALEVPKLSIRKF
jgi:hypothetical protein